MAKKKIDKSKLFGRILAGFIVVLMILGFSITLIYSIIKMF